MILLSQFLLFCTTVLGILYVHLVGHTDAALWLWLALALAIISWLGWICTIITIGRQPPRQTDHYLNNLAPSGPILAVRASTGLGWHPRMAEKAFTSRSLFTGWAWVAHG